MKSSSTESRIRGTLLGLAYGDVLGCPLETWKQSEISVVYGNYSELPTAHDLDKIKKHAPSQLTRQRPLGLYSDDSQQAMALINTCLQSGGYQNFRWATLLADGLRQRAWRGIGKNFVSAVKSLQNGKSFEHSGSPSAGIGAAMRTAPLGALYYNQKSILRKIALESSLTTHANVLAATTAYVVAYIAGRFIEGGLPYGIRSELSHVAKEAEDLLCGDAYKRWAIDKTHHGYLSHALTTLTSDFPASPLEIRLKVQEIASRYLKKSADSLHPNDGYALLGGLHAIALALQDDCDPHETLASICRLGDDTDTVAAICGGLLGARFGVDFVPISRFTDVKRVLGYADALVTRRLPETPADFLKAEIRLTKSELDYQRNIKA